MLDPTSMPMAAAKRAARLALKGAEGPLGQAYAVAALIDAISHEAATLGVDRVALFDGLARGIAIAAHNGAPDYASRRALWTSIAALSRSQLAVLDTLRVPQTPFAASQESGGAR